MTKKVYKQKYFSLTTKSLNWEILTKNLVTFKRWDGVRMKNFNGGSLIFGGVHKKPIHRGELPKRGT